VKDEFRITEEDLLAYVDGELDEARRHAVLQYLKQNPAVAQRIEADQKIGRELNSLFDPILNEEIPQKLLPKRLRSKRPMAKTSLIQMGIAAGLMMVSGLVGWVLHAQQFEVPVSQKVVMVDLVQPAAFAHTLYSEDMEHPVEFGPKEQQVLTRWISKRMKKDIVPPDLSLLGYELVGGRLLPSTNRMAVQFMYEDTGDQRITLYIRRINIDWGQPVEGFEYRESDGMGVLYWIKNGMAYALTGRKERSKLQAIAQEVIDTVPVRDTANVTSLQL